MLNKFNCLICRDEKPKSEDVIDQICPACKKPTNFDAIRGRWETIFSNMQKSRYHIMKSKIPDYMVDSDEWLLK